jgi:hypothetical protein
MGAGRVPGPVGGPNGSGGIRSATVDGLFGNAPSWRTVLNRPRDNYKWWVQEFDVGDLARSVGRIVVPGDTSIAEVLGVFFNPVDIGTGLWLMREDDSYTRLVRRWKPVKDMLAQLRADVIARPDEWKQKHMTDAKWKPTKADAPPPKAGFDRLAAKPAGTDPVTCEYHLKYFLATGIATDALHTAAVGSFRIIATASLLDPAERLAILDVWMFNIMSSTSFGQFGRQWPFNELPLRSQFMWWNWQEKFNYDQSGKVQPWRGYLKF